MDHDLTLDAVDTSADVEELEELTAPRWRLFDAVFAGVVGALVAGIVVPVAG